MTDLSTTNLKRLLAEATPGPWEYITGDSPDGRCIGNPGSMTMCIGVDANGHGSTCSDHDLTLAALAPQLAKEVMRLRKALDELYSAVVRTAEDCAIRDDHEGKLAARVAQSVSEQLFRILLEEDHDE